MLNPGLSSRYAKALVDLAVQTDRLEKVHQDALLLRSLLRRNPDIGALLDNPVVPAQKKDAIFREILEGKTDEITLKFCLLLISKGRETFLPQIMDALIVQYRRIRNISLVSLTTAVAVDQAILGEIITKVSEALSGREIEMESKVDPSLIGGFVLETGDRILDASIRNELHEIKMQFLDNSYIQKIR